MKSLATQLDEFLESLRIYEQNKALARQRHKSSPTEANKPDHPTMVAMHRKTASVFAWAQQKLRTLEVRTIHRNDQLRQLEADDRDRNLRYNSQQVSDPLTGDGCSEGPGFDSMLQGKPLPPVPLHVVGVVATRAQQQQQRASGVVHLKKTPACPLGDTSIRPPRDSSGGSATPKELMRPAALAARLPSPWRHRRFHVRQLRRGCCILDSMSTRRPQSPSAVQVVRRGVSKAAARRADSRWLGPGLLASSETATKNERY